MAQTFLSGPNPVLMRELRASLRNAKAFGLLALYVALLGAMVTATFPGDSSIDINSDGGRRGLDLFWTLFWGQIALVLLIIPSLATGALAQERERQTLQPLLLTPMSPLQIVWGKAAGVLSLVGLMLLATLPLTSLCFLLGGVSPGMLVAAYAAILGLAVFTTGFGLYCSARWHSATKALLSCYTFMPVVLGLVAVALPLGASFSGLFCLYLLGIGLVGAWNRGKNSGLAKRFDAAYSKAVYGFVPLALALILFFMWYDRNIGLIAVGVGFVFTYFLMATQWGMLQTARELMVRSDPEAPMRQKIEDLKDEWRGAVSGTAAPVPSAAAPSPTLAASSFSGYVPGAQGTGDRGQGAEWASVAPTSSPTPPLPLSQTSPAPSKQTYGVAPFLSDKLNPIFAREMRSGLLGKFEVLFRFSYGITIFSQVLLLGYLMLGIYEPTYLSSTDFSGPFSFWGKAHLALLMIFAAWFGARAIAPEREGQTLAQLFTIPLPAPKIIGGKMAAVLVFTLYVWVLAFPLSLFMAMLDLIPWGMTARFLLAEIALGFCAAAWGIFCSFHGETVRKSLASSLGTVAALLLAPGLLPYLFDLARTLQFGLTAKAKVILTTLFPTPLAFETQAGGEVWPLIVALYATLGAFFLLVTARNFKRLARES